MKGERADAAFAAHCQGAEDEREELIRWHDPKEELPPIEKVVLVKLNFGRGYALADRGDEYWRRVYAGHIAGGLASHNGLNIIGSEIIVAKASCSMADALIEELEKDEKVL